MVVDVSSGGPRRHRWILVDTAAGRNKMRYRYVEVEWKRLGKKKYGEEEEALEYLTSWVAWLGRFSHPWLRQTLIDHSKLAITPNFVSMQLGYHTDTRSIRTRISAPSYTDSPTWKRLSTEILEVLASRLEPVRKPVSNQEWNWSGPDKLSLEQLRRLEGRSDET